MKRELGPLIFHRKDFHYYGLQNGDECHCGNSFHRFLPTYHSQCNRRCDGDRLQFCGNIWRMNVFQNQFKSNNSSFKETQAISSTRPTYTVSVRDTPTGNTSLGPVFEETSPVHTTLPALTITEADYETRIIEYGSGDHLTESEESHTSLVHVSGSIPTQYDFVEDFAIKESEKYENFENEIKKILESNSLVENADVTLTGIKMNSSNRRRRSTGKIIIEFTSLLSIRVPTIDDMDEIESNVCGSIQAIDSTRFESFDADSFSACHLSFSKPRILPFKAPSKAEIDAKIG